ncbi:MAG TPA: NADH-ubiquinone oxidoreductase-F iron-sulfur binding region domain-containing protein [Dehalococcoidales bacterium]|nr:NADH-ubiquinone oxidoreductase-F iron-sulfur binding region domain-containing protein [Dehalococcoidales bacterium]
MPEKRIILKNCGVIDPKQIDSYLKQDGFKALQKAKAMTPEQVIAEVKASNLRGRGGAGFPAGLKWEGARNAPGADKYVVCNADEGEVGTFKDRYILENDPFSLIEGIAIASYALGARQAFIYLRGEYGHLLDSVRNAISQAKAKGFLNHVDIEVREGSGAYICGEEMALMESIEGKRGEIRYKPPFPTTNGLWQMPTVINNVETLMNVPQIILNGAAWYNQIGTERSKGTKVFAVAGDVARPGVYEMVMGSPLRDLIIDLSGAKNIKLIQIGGATGNIVPASMLDTKLAFAPEGMLSAGPITVYDETRDVLDIVHRTMEFLAEESCGKCSPCREGTGVMVHVLEEFAKGEAREKDIQSLEALSSAMMLCSLCGLGQAAPNCVVDTLKYFRSAYEERIKKAEVVKK